MASYLIRLNYAFIFIQVLDSFQNLLVVRSAIRFVWILDMNCFSAGLMKAGREAEAMAVISALEDKPYTDPEVQKTFHAVREAMALEGSKPGASEKTSLSELFTGGRSQNFRRVAFGLFYTANNICSCTNHRSR